MMSRKRGGWSMLECEWFFFSRSDVFLSTEHMAHAFWFQVWIQRSTFTATITMIDLDKGYFITSKLYLHLYDLFSLQRCSEYRRGIIWPGKSTGIFRFMWFTFKVRAHWLWWKEALAIRIKLHPSSPSISQVTHNILTSTYSKQKLPQIVNL